MNRQILVFVCALTLATRVQIGAIDLNRPLHEHDYEQEQEYGKTQKYTCPMHPEVVTDHPGNCPKCGMKLVPLKQNKRRTSNSEGSRAGAEHATPKVGAIDLNRPGHEHDHPPSHGYGAAGEHEQEKMHMEMHSTVNLADPMNREGSGTSWLPDSSPMYGKMFM